MLTIDLIHKENSQVEFDLFKFPDGEPHFKFINELDHKEEYLIKCRITSPEDLYVVLQVCDILTRYAVIYSIDIYYLMSMRMDRVVSFNESFTLQLVMAQIMATSAFKVRVLCPHSLRTLKFSDRVSELYPELMKTVIRQHQSNSTICAPDAGMAKKLDSISDALLFEKQRDYSTNKISNYRLSYIPNKVHNTILVVDDLLDTGGTACKAYDILREKFPEAKINYFAIHAVNINGIERLSKVFDNVYITDSFNDWDLDFENVHVTKVTLPQN